MAWLRGEGGDQGPHLMNLQSFGMLPWMQQRVDPTILRNDLNQQYQAMLATGLQNFGSGDMLKQQLMQFQQPVQYLQHAGSHNPLLQQQQQQQAMQQQQAIHQHMLPAQTQMDNVQRQPQQQVGNQMDDQAHQHSYQEAYQISHSQLQQKQPSNIPSQSFSKPDFADPNSKFAASIAPSVIPMGLGSLCSEGSSNFLNFNRIGQQSVIMEQPPQKSWMSKFGHSELNAGSNSSSLPAYGKDTSTSQETCSLDAQNQTLFGANVDSSGLLLPTTVSNVSTTSIDADMSAMPLGTSGFQNSLYGYVQDSSDLLHNAGQVDPLNATRTFVKVQILMCRLCISLTFSCI